MSSTNSVEDKVFKVINEQLIEDMRNMKDGKSISLLSKWCPSINTSSSSTVKLAKYFCKKLSLSEKTYRKTLSKMRSYLSVIEQKMSAGNWAEIDYNTVPSMANLKYKNAFLKHDETRRRQYLADLEKPESGAKINSSASFPCDIVASYCKQAKFGWYTAVNVNVDAALEAMWKALPDYVAGNANGSTIVVADSSGSMTAKVAGSQMSAIDVAFSLAIYFSEKLTGPFKNKWITFSGRPQYVDMSNCQSLADKLILSYSKAEVANTDLMKTFMLILKTAVDNNLKQEDLPSNVLLVSDMNFDQGTYQYGSYSASKCSLMKEIADKFAEHGYKLPRCIYWSICGGIDRTSPIPVQQMDNGCVFVSGFSPAIANLVFSAKLNPFDALVDALSVKRYDAIEKAFIESESK